MGIVFIYDRRWLFAVTVSAALLLHPVFKTAPSGHEAVAFARNYFGVKRVTTDGEMNYLYHGTTLHGIAGRAYGGKTPVPYGYYHPDGPAGDVFRHVAEDTAAPAVAAIGLGAGAVKCLLEQDARITFFEIDPQVVSIASNPDFFPYLSGCPAGQDIRLGDARIEISKKAPEGYDLIFMDAFSSDNIPVHLLTREALAIYLDKLAPEGILLIHISNRYFDLRPETKALAAAFGLHGAYRRDAGAVNTESGADNRRVGSVYVVLARSGHTLDPLLQKSSWKALDLTDAQKPWRDNYANLLRTLMIFSGP